MASVEHDFAAPMRPVVWSIAGSDSGAGAGLQADLRTLDSFDVQACTVVAAITAQNSVAVERVEAVVTDLLDAQLAALARDMPPRAIKTGLLGSAANARCVAAWVDRLRRDGPVALVVDPVWRATTGADLASSELREVLVRELLPRATAITPNRAEAAWLLGWDAGAIGAASAVPQAAAALRALGPGAVVITGGDARDGDGGDTLDDMRDDERNDKRNDKRSERGEPIVGARSLDWIDTPQASGWLSLPRVESPHHHGSGCVFAAAMAAALALDFCAADAAVIAKMSATHAIRHGVPAGQGAGAVRPGRGFALAAGSIPALHRDATSEARKFVPLTDRHMGLYAVVDSAAWVERVLDAGVRTVQLRIKQASGEQLSREVLRSGRAARAVQAQLFINDHWRLAIEHGAYGVHLGQEDLATADMKALREAGVRVGLSTHCYWEVARARAWSPSYIACGPIHATTTKAMPWRPQGAGNLAYWCRVLQEPVVAIAGMDAERSREAMRCGAAGVAVLRGVMQASDPERVVSALRSAIATGRSEAPLTAPELPRSTLG